MDPIEKMLSDLAPANARGDLDRAMKHLFDRAESRARRRRIFRYSAAMVATLTIGLGAGYGLRGERTVPVYHAPQAPSVTYIYPAQTHGPAPALDLSVPKAEWLHSSEHIFVETHVTPAVFSSLNSGSR